jgi:hypothetical protein
MPIDSMTVPPDLYKHLAKLALREHLFTRTVASPQHGGTDFLQGATPRRQGRA